MTPFDDFLTRVLRRPIPKPPLERLRLFARELAEGAIDELWRVEIGFVIDRHRPPPAGLRSPDFGSEAFNRYLERRWRNQPPNWYVMQQLGYVQLYPDMLEIRTAAFALLDDHQPSSVFISYRRKDSSAFALLVRDRLRAHQIDAYLDMELRPGSFWRDSIHHEIRTREMLVMLIGHETLASEMVQQEIVWALDADVTIVPIWHNGFTYPPAIPVPPKIDYALTYTHTIRVLEESARAYHNALIDLLAQFGVRE
jgi:hypothetical protein